MSWLKSMMDKEPPEPENPIGIVVIGNLDPDVHEASSEQVRKALKRAQFKVVKLGKKVPAEVFASKAKEVNADIIAVSVNTTPAKDNLPKLLPAIESTGLKNRVGLMIGGAAVQSEDAEKIGAIYGKTKEEAVAIAKKILEEKKAK
ncbi:MAG: cobalamin-dependent protein [Candidatus Bathyarchaeota archaeon]|nr:cobalamin-dependent protein [Candidatus Bathyarchaeota archaeon]MDH5747302.1 cobalamin-dependent protein [Candidatus Bathyarchaeota archaeon]